MELLRLSGKTLVEVQEFLDGELESVRKVMRGLALKRVDERVLHHFDVQVRRLDRMNLLAKHMELSLDRGGEIYRDMVRVLEGISELKYKTCLLRAWGDRDVFDVLTSITLHEMKVVGMLEEVSRYVLDHFPVPSWEQYRDFSLLAGDRERFLQVHRLIERKNGEGSIEDYQIFHAIFTGDEERYRTGLDALISNRRERYEQVFKKIVERYTRVNFDNMLSFYLDGVAPYEMYLYPLLWERR